MALAGFTASYVNVDPVNSTKMISVSAVPVSVKMRCWWIHVKSVDYLRITFERDFDRVAYKPFAQAFSAIALFAVTKLKLTFVRAKQIGSKSFHGRLSPSTSRLINRCRRPCLRRKRKRHYRLLYTTIPGVFPFASFVCLWVSVFLPIIFRYIVPFSSRQTSVAVLYSIATTTTTFARLFSVFVFINYNGNYTRAAGNVAHKSLNGLPRFSRSPTTAVIQILRCRFDTSI